MKKLLIILIPFIFITIQTPVFAEVLPGPEPNLPAPTANVSPSGYVNASWTACTHPNFSGNYKVQVGDFADIINVYKTPSYTTTNLTYNFPSPILTSYKKFYVLVQAIDNEGMIPPTCLHDTLIANNPIYAVPTPTSLPVPTATTTPKKKITPAPQKQQNDINEFESTPTPFVTPTTEPNKTPNDIEDISEISEINDLPDTVEVTTINNLEASTILAFGGVVSTSFIGGLWVITKKYSLTHILSLFSKIIRVK